MRTPLLAALFAVATAALVAAVDLLLSLAYQPPPVEASRAAFIQGRVFMHGSILSLCFIGSLVGFLLVRNAPPSLKLVAFMGLAFGLVSLVAGPGSFVLLGAVGAAAWFAMGSLAVALGSKLFTKPWRRVG